MSRESEQRFQKAIVVGRIASAVVAPAIPLVLPHFVNADTSASSSHTYNIGSESPVEKLMRELGVVSVAEAADPVCTLREVEIAGDKLKKNPRTGQNFGVFVVGRDKKTVLAQSRLDDQGHASIRSITAACDMENGTALGYWVFLEDRDRQGKEFVTPNNAKEQIDSALIALSTDFEPKTPPLPTVTQAASKLEPTTTPTKTPVVGPVRPVATVTPAPSGPVGPRNPGTGRTDWQQTLLDFVDTPARILAPNANSGTKVWIDILGDIILLSGVGFVAAGMVWGIRRIFH